MLRFLNFLANFKPQSFLPVNIGQQRSHWALVQPAHPHNQLTCLLDTSWGHLCIYYLFWNNAWIDLNSNTLSLTAHFSQSASFVASTSYRQLQAQPHFITVPSGNIYENTRCSHQRVVIFLDYSERELLVNLRDARDQKYKCWNFMR